jgi:glycosyltransferase involved in cell wall biosynthesis
VTSCTIVVPTRDRHDLLVEAVDSALGQRDSDVEVVVVDDGSRDPVALPSDPRLRVARHLRPRGVSAARNLGISLSATPYVAFLDDDDRIRPHLVARSLELLGQADEPAPVAALTAVAVVDANGRTREVRKPPTSLPRGSHFSLEPSEPGRSYLSKQTLVAPRETLLAIGGFDERFRSRVVTELFWRLNEVCSIVGADDVTYELHAHPGPRLSGDRRLRQRSFRQLVDVHRDLLARHPEGHAELLLQHARTSYEAGQPVAALTAAVRSLKVSPRRFGTGLLRTLRPSAT